MADWLSRATDAFRKQAPPAPETYEVGCDCGVRLSGERTSAAQRPACPTCGGRVFVLPANVYPRTVKPVQPLPPLPVRPTKTTKKGRDTPVKGAASKTPLPTNRQPDFDALVPSVSESGIALDTRTRLITPVRLIVLAMLAVCGLTGWGLLRRYRIESAKAIVAKATDEGIRAIREGNFDGAARDLMIAREAVDLLKRTDAEAQSVRRLCREAIAARGLASDSLLEAIHKSLADIRLGDKETKRFDGLYRDAWVLFDAKLIVPDDAARPSLVDLAITHAGRPVRIETRSELIRRAAQQSPAESPHRVIFAAKLARLSPAHDAQTEAVLTLDDDSAFLWGTFETYAALGYTEDDAEELRRTRELLERQLEATMEMK